MKIGLVGWGVEAQSAYRYFGGEHTYNIVNEEPRDDFPQSENVHVYCLDNARQPGLVGNISDLSYLDHLDDCELIIYQPSSAKNLEKHFAPDHEFWKKAKTIQHIFFETCPTRNIIGVTGTKGKGTTTTLIAKILQAGGLVVHVGGNIGRPTLDLLPNISPDSWVVLELSSFQLYKFPYSPHIAVHLMIMPEHIEEWHKTMDDYVESKRNIFLHQTPQDIAVYYPANAYSQNNVSFSAGVHLPYSKQPGAFINSNDELEIEGQIICSKHDFKLLGEHNVQNICAAVTACWSVIKDLSAIRQVVTTFSGLEHRLELAGIIGGVSYYDDSFGTTPDTSIVAMDAFTQNKVMIVGGHDKGNPMELMAKRLAGDDIRHVVCIGTIGNKLADLALSYGLAPNRLSIREDGNSWTMEEIINEVGKFTQEGDVVLLSTGCASFGIFKDYKDRGNQFKAAVASLSANQTFHP